MPVPSKQQRNQNITFEDARIVFRNFEGKKDKYNAAGARNFCVLLDDDIANQLAADGWNIRWLAAREEGDSDQAYMPIAVSYLHRPPKVVLISSSTRKQTYLDEEDIHMLDWAEIETVDFIVSPYHWDVNGKTGIKAYLKKMFVTLVEDELELKYSQDVEEMDLEYDGPEPGDDDWDE